MSLKEDNNSHNAGKKRGELEFAGLDDLITGCDDSPIRELCVGCAYNCTLPSGCYRTQAPVFTICKDHCRPECGTPCFMGCCLVVPKCCNPC